MQVRSEDHPRDERPCLLRIPPPVASPRILGPDCASDDGKGKFRLIVVPDEADRPWPSDRFLRQGVRVKAWVLLNRVTMAYELWRQLNAFPPLLTPESPNMELAKQKLK